MNSKKIVAFAFGILVPVLVASDGVAAPNKAAFKHCRLTVGKPMSALACGADKETSNPAAKEPYRHSRGA